MAAALALTARVSASARRCSVTSRTAANQGSGSDFDGAKANFDGKLSAVTGYPRQGQILAHRPNLDIVEVTGNMRPVARPRGIGYENFDCLADQSSVIVAEHGFCVTIDHDDLAVAVDDNHRIGNRFEKPG